MSSNIGKLKQAASQGSPSKPKSTPNGLFSLPQDVGKLPGKNTGDTTAKVLGKAENTQARINCGKRFASGILVRLGLPPVDSLKECHVENDNLEDMLWRVASYASTYPIPYNFKDDLSPPHPEATRALVLSTIMGYLGDFKNLLRRLFPEHPVWPKSESDNPSFWKELTSSMESEFKRNKLTVWNNGEFTFGNQRNFPLYPNSFHCSGRKGMEDLEEMRAWYGDDLESSGALIESGIGVDLRGVIVRRMALAHHHQPSTFREISRDVLTYNMVNRGGEVKFCRWSELEYQNSWNVFVLKKNQQKTLTGTAQALAANPVDCWDISICVQSFPQFPEAVE